MSFLKPAIALGSTLWLLAANSGLEAPRIGFVRLADDQVWALRGIAGSFYFGERMASHIDRIAFNGQAGVRTSGSQAAELLGPNGEVLRTARIDGEVRAIGLSVLEASGYVLTDVELWRLASNAVERFRAPELPQGHLVGIGGAGSYVDLASVLDGQVTLRRVWLQSGESVVRETFVAQAEHLLLLNHGMLLWSAGDALVLRRPDASLVKIETGSHIVALQEAGSGWFHATGEDGRQFAVRLRGDPRQRPADVEMSLKLLPESAR